MKNAVTITSKGQTTIPALYRRKSFSEEKGLSGDLKVRVVGAEGSKSSNSKKQPEQTLV